MSGNRRCSTPRSSRMRSTRRILEEEGAFTGTQPSSARAGVFATIPARQAAEASADAEARSASVAVEFTLRNNPAPALPWIPAPTFRTSAALTSSDFMNTYYYV